MGKSRVAIVRCASYDLADVYSAVKKAVEISGARIPRNATVLLKPNVLSPKKPEFAVTTHPAIVDAVCKLLKEAKCRIIIGESDGVGMTEQGFEVSGIKGVADKYKARIVIFEKDLKVRVHNGKNRVVKEIFLPKALMEADFIINLPKLKTHALTKYTGAIKNMFGTVPGATKSMYHKTAPTEEKFSEALVDIYTFSKPNLVIMDAIVGMEGMGPGNGTPKKTGLVLASADGVALDSVASSLIGLNPEDIFHIKYAFQRGISDRAAVETFGEEGRISEQGLREYSVKYNKAPAVNKNLMALGQRLFAVFSPRPVLTRNKCTGCMVCVKHCPVNAISFKKYPQIDRKKCIKCFCCAELCAYGAMNVEGPRMLEILKKALGIIRRRKRKK